MSKPGSLCVRGDTDFQQITPIQKAEGNEIKVHWKHTFIPFYWKNKNFRCVPNSFLLRKSMGLLSPPSKEARSGLSLNIAKQKEIHFPFPGMLASLAALQKAGKTAASCGTWGPHHEGQLHWENSIYLSLQHPGPAQVVKPFWILGKAFPNVGRGDLHPSPLAMAELRTDVCYSPPACIPRDRQIYGGKTLPIVLFFSKPLAPREFQNKVAFIPSYTGSFQMAMTFMPGSRFRLALSSWKSVASFAEGECRASSVSHSVSHWQSYICHLLLFLWAFDEWTIAYFIRYLLPRASNGCFCRS